MVLINILVFLICLSLVIILHELGHFIMARRAGILCHEFSLGMGPVIWKTKKGETTYSVRAIPIGGYVSMAGEEISDELVKVGNDIRVVFEEDRISKIILDHTDPRYQDALKITVESIDLQGKDSSPLYINDYPVKRDAFYILKKQELQIAPYERGFEGKTFWQRFNTIFAGPLMNFILAFFVFLLVNLMVGFPNMDSTVISTIGSGLPAETVLEVGDEITAVNGEAVSDWDEMSLLLDEYQTDRTLELTINRDDAVVVETITPVLYFYSIGFHSDLDSGETLAIGEVPEDTQAYNAGMQDGDTLFKFYNTETNEFVTVTTWDEVATEVTRIGNLPYEEDYEFDIVVLRDGEEITLTIEEPFSESFLESQGVSIIESRIGISPEYSFSLLGSLSGGLKNVWSSAGIIFTTIGLLFDNSGAGAGIGVDNLAGPLGIYEITSSALSQGLISLLSWVGLLSVNLGVINLLPIPALDGGRLVFLIYEGITKRKPNKKVENTIHYVMYLALMGLFVFITYNDLLRLLNIK